MPVHASLSVSSVCLGCLLVCLIYSFLVLSITQFVILLMLQALPLSTVVVGRATTSGLCRVVTMSQHVDEPRSVEFQLPKSDKDLLPGQPSWANYVKGVIAFFPHKGFSNCFHVITSCD